MATIDDMTDAIELLASGTYSVSRPTGAPMVDGRIAGGASITMTVQGSLQPSASGKQIERLPEGLRNREMMTLFTGTELRTAGGAATEPDRLTIDGVSWEVSGVERWMQLGNYYRVTLTRGPE